MEKKGRLSKEENKTNNENKSNDSMKVKVKVKPLSRAQLFATPWTVTYQAPQSMEFSRQEDWSGLPFPSPDEF